MTRKSLLIPAPLFSRLGMLLFWLAVFVINAGPHWEVYVSNRELIETAGMITALQALVAYFGVSVFAPSLLDKGKMWQFAVAVFIIIVIASNINIIIRFFYLEPLYPLSYKGYLSLFGEMSFAERIDPRWTMRYIIFSKLPNLGFPMVLLLAYSFYQKQQSTLRLREQKRSAELNALKNQLNPHFIFNTLNNIYALALKKSDQTPIAIEKLSSILDYVVYRCNDNYVSLDAEVKLVEDYIALEKIRYGKRLEVSIKNDIVCTQKIAPLLLLTLVENACKHSAQQELKQALVRIEISSSASQIKVLIRNSKPSGRAQYEVGHASQEGAADKVGLSNLKKQLALLYPNAHQLEIDEDDSYYQARLQLKLPKGSQA